MFGLSRIPKPQPHSFTSIPRILQEMYHFQNDDEEKNHFEIGEKGADANTVRHHNTKDRYELGPNEHFFLYDFSLPENEELHHSELVIHSEFPNNSTKVNIFHVS